MIIVPKHVPIYSQFYMPNISLLSLEELWSGRFLNRFRSDLLESLAGLDFFNVNYFYPVRYKFNLPAITVYFLHQTGNLAHSHQWWSWFLIYQQIREDLCGVWTHKTKIQVCSDLQKEWRILQVLREKVLKLTLYVCLII